MLPTLLAYIVLQWTAWEMAQRQAVAFAYLSFAWLPLVFLAYSIGRRRMTIRSLLIFTAAEAVALGLATILYRKLWI